MNKEQLRKELEDCWAVACKWFEIAGGPPEKFIANRDTYINGKLAEVQNYESLAQDAIRDIDLIADFADFGAKEKLGMIEKAILKYWEDCKKPITTHLAALDDGDGLRCSLDAQQCQQECEHKEDRTKCPFTKSAALDDGQEGKGLRWVKASERLPDKNWKGSVKTLSIDGNWIYQTITGWEVERLLSHELDLQSEWLDEGQPE